MRRVLLLLVLVAAASSFASRADARSPDTFEEDYAPPINIESPQWLGFELRIGPYTPGGTRAFKQSFGDDRGWLLSLELDVTLWHIPYVGTINAGAGWGWAKYSGKSFDSAGSTTGEDNEFILFPLSALAVLRVDALARYTVVPLQFAAKLGGDFVRWKSTTAGSTDASGLNKGLRWALQTSLELDFFQRGAARRLDEDYGINHTYILFEYYGSKTEGTGDKNFVFGLGMLF